MVMHGPLLFTCIRIYSLPMNDRPSSFASTASAEGRKSPNAVYGALFQRVQLTRVFPDGKTFADAVPRGTLQAIMAAFAEADPHSRDELRAFVGHHFAVPSPTLAVQAGAPRPTLQAYIKALWAKLERRPQPVTEGDSALYLPEPYVVPGGRFREIYYWDSYFTMLGLAHDGRGDLVEAMLHNFESLVERFGHIPNGTRTYYLSRSQPPFLALMIDLSRATEPAEKRRQLAAMHREHAYWMNGDSAVVMPDGAILNRYWDELDTPREESFAEDVATAGLSGRPAAEVYRDLRAGAASGWDFSSRWLGDPADFTSIHTSDIVPVDLNSLLWRLETSIARACHAMGQADRALEFEACAERREQAMQRYLWLEAEQRFADYDLRAGAATPVLSAATLYPLFVGLASQAQADAVAATVQSRLLARGGLRTTTNTTDQQWDMPNGWAPLQWIAVTGLTRYGHGDLARDIAARWLGTVATAYNDTGKLLEKYDIENLKPGGGGEYPVQDGFGWTNGVTRALMAAYPDLITEPA